MRVTIEPENLAIAQSDDIAIFLIDVREPEEFARGALAGARNVPLSALSIALADLAPDDHLVFVCQSGERSLKAANFARSVGYAKAQSLEGGMRGYDGQV